MLAAPGTLPNRVDLLALGGGLARYAAALETTADGAVVVLLERATRFGGSSLQSSCSFAFAGTQLQWDARVEDSVANMAYDILKASGNLAGPALVSLYVEHCVKFRRVMLTSNQSVPRTHATDPHQIMEALHGRAIGTRNIHYFKNAAAIRLLAGPQRDRVAGATVKFGDKTRDVRATAGVVLATGGFSRNADLIGKFAPRRVRALRLGRAGNTGDGLLMAWKWGADLVGTAYVSGTFGISLNRCPAEDSADGEEALLRLAIFRGGIEVNLAAERFADQSISHKKLGEICLVQPRGIGFQIWDQKIMAQSVLEPNATDFEGAYAKGLVRQADTIAGLAETVQLDPAKLRATIERYNRDVDAGRDSLFGRMSLGRGSGQLVRIDTWPYFIFTLRHANSGDPLRRSRHSAIGSRRCLRATHCGSLRRRRDRDCLSRHRLHERTVAVEIGHTRPGRRRCRSGERGDSHTRRRRQIRKCAMREHGPSQPRL